MEFEGVWPLKLQCPIYSCYFVAVEHSSPEQVAVKDHGDMRSRKTVSPQNGWYMVVPWIQDSMLLDLAGMGSSRLAPYLLPFSLGHKLGIISESFIFRSNFYADMDLMVLK